MTEALPVAVSDVVRLPLMELVTVMVVLRLDDAVKLKEGDNDGVLQTRGGGRGDESGQARRRKMMVCQGRKRGSRGGSDQMQ